LSHELLTIDEDSPYWAHQLSVTCEEGAKVKALRKQIRLLTDHLTDPANLLPLDDWTMQT
jgi:hypothetical protein